jgi:hypothetical protein
MLMRTATELDLDAITWIHMAAVPLDPECPYRYVHREQYPEDHWKFSRMEYASYMRDEKGTVIKVLEMPSIESSFGENKPVAFSIWHLPGSHTEKPSPSCRDDGRIGKLFRLLA